MILLDGASAAHKIREEVARAVALLDRPVGLTVVMVGEHHASKLYVATKKRACAAVGIASNIVTLPESVAESDLLSKIDALNGDDAVDGILVQTPLPDAISTDKVMRALSERKDVDGFHPVNVGKLLMGQEDGFVSCTPLGIQQLLAAYKIPIEGKRVVILGRSNIVGKPLAALLMQKGPHANATVTVAHSKSEGLRHLLQEADILVAALGSPHFIGPSMVKSGAVVVDVGINRLTDPSREKGYRVVGDVDFEKVKDKCYAITPVPGGVGPMTVASLLQNTLKAHCLRSS